MSKPNETNWGENILEGGLVLIGLAFAGLLAIGKIYLTHRDLVYVYDHLPEYEITIKCTDHQFKDKANLILNSSEYAAVNDEDELITHIIPDNCKIIESFQLGSPLDGYNPL